MIKEEEEDKESRQGEEQLRHRYEELCSSLNMDERARGEAWDSYGRISQNYTLEGNSLHWLACALYVACRQAVPTVGRGTVEGNYVSLTRILSSSELSLIEFFNKMKKWEDMANLPEEFRQRTEKLERNFTVTAVLFQKYNPLFLEIFKNPQEEQPRQHRGRKQSNYTQKASLGLSVQESVASQTNEEQLPTGTALPFLMGVRVCLSAARSCRCLFLLAGGNFPMISDDLVNSYHLLLCTLDLVYGNALQCANRRELLNPNFSGLPEDFQSKDFKPPAESPCIIETLCSLHNGLLLDAKGIKEHFWKPYIRKLFHRKVLKGKSEALTGFLDPGNFAECLKSINKAYEGYVLSAGHLDERVFFGDAVEEIGSIGRCLNSAETTGSTERAQLTQNLQQHFEMMKSLQISTPLTSLKYIRDSNPYTTPVSSAAYSVSRLFAILSGLKPSPSEKLLQMLRSCSRDPTQAIVQRLKDMFETFCEHTVSEGEDSQYCKDIARKYFCFAEVFYYKVLETIINQEKKRLGDADLSVILEQDVFHRSLLACCLEIIIFAYKPSGNFPQIIVMFDLVPYDFYKVIEIFIKAEDGLCREMVKHLKHIEEQILESMAWELDSPLWEKIRENDGKIPFCKEVMPPQHYVKSRCSSLTSSPTPLTPRRVNEIRADAAGLARSVPSSPVTLSERYSSPAAGTTRRRLFIDTDSPSDAASTPQASQSVTPAEPASAPPVPGQTLVTMATATVTANNGQTVTIPVQGIANESGGITFFPVQVNVSSQPHNVASSVQPLTAQALAGPVTPQPMQITATQVPSSPSRQNLASAKLKKANSFSLFCRKVYTLASVRLQDLCQKLDISDDLRDKIWTCLEYSLVHYPDMMKDRHLDQLLMCAVYVMAKITKENISFHSIMGFYRTQPHARSDVYRSVLLKRCRRQSGSNPNAQETSPLESREPSPVVRYSSTLPLPQPSSAPSTPTQPTGAISDLEADERGHLVQFYNSIYIEKMESFAKKYSKANMNETTPLSPFPSIKALSPRRVQLSLSHPIYISPHNVEASSMTSGEKICYYFNLSPAKRLQDINSMVRTGETPTKKRGIILEEGSESPAKRMCPENHTALLRRLRDVANDRGSL
ncbi:retinoblastoma-like protein 2 [Spea bombifrons]|uniref:retinoblastoma-like protein 2 n=1 Tax=Spea bombifrons TaxID=233779 RepID=UPI00234A5568|nr:retinoblastoma-like protein 2 [Spea bombifrons]